MKTTKKILSILLALLMITSIIPMASITASAATRTADEAIAWCKSYANTNKGIDADSNGSYACVDLTIGYYKYLGAQPYYGNACDYATLKQSQLPSGWTITKGGTPQKGDILIYVGGLGHVAIYETDYYTYHQNWSGSYVERIDLKSKGMRYDSSFYVKAENVTKTYWGCIHPDFKGSTPTPPINFVTGLQGDYYLQSKNTGEWLSVSENKDASTQPINTWGTWYKEFRVNLTAAGNGYKIKFPLISSLLMNPYSDYPTVGTKVNLYQDVNDVTQQWGFEKVGDAYAIRSMYNTSLCLTDNGVMPATLTTYTGAANQLWYLHPYSYTVSYNANGGSEAPSSQTKHFNENLTLSSTKPTRSGYTFVGWGTSSGDTTVDYYAGGTYTKNADITLYAIWKENIKTYTISYNANGGTGAPSSQTKTHGTSLTLSSVEPTKDGYLFLGWTTDDMYTIEYLPGSSFTNDESVTLYAVWVEISELILNNEWTVWTSTDIWVTSLSVATGSDKPDVAYYYVPQETGKYIFYSTNASDSEVYLYNDSGEQIGYDDDSGENLNFRLECELVAGKEYTFLLDGVSGCNVGFGEIYTITYDANGGTGAPQSQLRAFNEVLLLSDTIPSRSGYTFLGWSDSGPSGGVTYQPGAEMRYLAQDITLYAVWQANAVAVPEVHVSSTSVNLKLSETESTDVYVWATGVTCSYTVQYQIADTSIVSCVWGGWDSENKCPLTITAKAKGATTVTVSVINYETKEILDSIVITVNVGVSSSYVDFNIKEPSTTTIRYKDGIVLHINGYIPEGGRVEWAIDSNAFDGGVFDNGMSCLLVSKNNGYATVVATLYDANNNVIATDSVELRSKAGFFDKIGGFFCGLFGATKVYDA